MRNSPKHNTRELDQCGLFTDPFRAMRPVSLRCTETGGKEHSLPRFSTQMEELHVILAFRCFLCVRHSEFAGACPVFLPQRFSTQVEEVQGDWWQGTLSQRDGRVCFLVADPLLCDTFRNCEGLVPYFLPRFSTQVQEEHGDWRQGALSAAFQHSSGRGARDPFLRCFLCVRHSEFAGACPGFSLRFST